MDILAVIMQWIHLVSVVLAVGGIFTLRFIGCPAMQKVLPDDGTTRDQLLLAIVRRFKIVVHCSIALLLISGLYLLFKTPSLGIFKASSAYRHAMETKIVLALVLFFISIMLTMTKAKPNRFQQKRDKWMTINFAIALVIILIAAFLRRLQ